MKKLVVVVLSTSTACAGDAWVRLDQPGWEVWSDAGESKAKQALRTLQEIRQIVLAIDPSVPPRSRTLRLILFRSEDEFARFRPAGNFAAAGYFLAGRQYDYIVTRNGIVPENRSVLFHESLHLFLHDRNLPIPHWFEEGMAELFSNVQSTRTEIEVGLPIANHVRVLLAQDDIDLRTLFTSANDPLFYAKSWALVRLLTLDAAYRSHLEHFLELVSKGETHAEAFEKAFGKSVTQVSVDVRRSLAGQHLQPWVMKTTLLSASLPVPTVQPSSLAAELVLVDLLENLQRFDEARRSLLDLAKQNDRNAEIEALLGDLALRQTNPAEAFEHYSRAIQFGVLDPRVYFERAMLRRDDESARSQVIADLRKAVELKPDYTEAFQQLNALSLRGQAAPARAAPAKTPANRSGNRKVDGTFIRLDCSTTPVHFIVNTAGGELVLAIADPAQIVIGNDTGATTELNCGSTPPRAVTVEYIEASKEITAIQFK